MLFKKVLQLISWGPFNVEPLPPLSQVFRAYEERLKNLVTPDGAPLREPQELRAFKEWEAQTWAGVSGKSIGPGFFLAEGQPPWGVPGCPGTAFPILGQNADPTRWVGGWVGGSGARRAPENFGDLV